MIIDVSVHNGTIDWNAVKAAGIEGAILRCGYGQDKASQDDKQFTRNAVECMKLGIPFGVYLYSYASDVAGAESEARHALRLAEGLDLALPIIFDAEESKLASVSAVTWKTFANAVKAAGHKVGLYTGEYFYNAHMQGTSIYADMLWIAKYGTNSGQPQKQPVLKDGSVVNLWQYTSRGQCAGITSSGLDCSLILTEGLLSASDVTEQATKTVDELAQEVVAGLWGNGDDRKARLAAAGYSYSDVQKAVNALFTKKSNEDIAAEVIAGQWGNGRDRVNRLTAAGYNAEAIQTIVNSLC